MDHPLRLLKNIPLLVGKQVDQIPFEIVTFDPHQMIFHEGDFADAFYIILEGDIHIFTCDLTGKMVVLARLGKGNFFGERAFSQAHYPVRTASVKTIAKTTLAKIPRSELVNFSDKNRLREIFNDYLEDKLRKTLPPERFEKTKSFLPREILFEAGSQVSNVYILLEGTVECRTYDKQGNVTSQLEPQQGEIFGDDGERHTHTAVALTEVVVLEISSNDFKEIHSRMGKNARERYQFTSFGKSLQFRGRFHDHSTWATLIFLKDGRQILCHQAMEGEIVSIETLGVTPEHSEKSENETTKREVFYAEDKIVGIQSFGANDDCNEYLKAIVEKKGGVAEFEAPFDAMVVCTCMRVPKSEIENAIKCGSTTLENVQNETKACTVCGACRPVILEMLGREVWIPCNIQESHRHNDYIRTFRLSPTLKKTLPFIPGQHVIVKAEIDGLNIQRSYTLTSHPKDPYFEITVKREELGIFSRWIFANANHSPIIHLAGPYGEFVLNQALTPIVCFAGGIGITPFVGFAKELANASKPFLIDYSARTSSDFVFRALLEKNCPQINFRATDVVGLLTKDEILQIVNAQSNPDVYICGPSGFESFIVDTLQEANFPAKRIHVEQFVQAGAPQDTPQMVTF